MSFDNWDMLLLCYFKLYIFPHEVYITYKIPYYGDKNYAINNELFQIEQFSFEF